MTRLEFSRAVLQEEMGFTPQELNCLVKTPGPTDIFEVPAEILPGDRGNSTPTTGRPRHQWGTNNTIRQVTGGRGAAGPTATDPSHDARHSSCRPVGSGHIHSVSLVKEREIEIEG